MLEFDDLLPDMRAALDDVITVLGRPCRLVHPARWTPCANCVSDPTGRTSLNRWKNGGPMPFPAGSTCPACGGQGGYKAEEASEQVTLRVEWSPAKFWIPVPHVLARASNALVQTKGFAQDAQKVLACDHLELVTPAGVTVRVGLVASPVSPWNLVKDRYFVATWEAK